MIGETFLYGVYGVVMFFFIAYYNIRILENFESHPEIAMSNFFNKEKSSKAFKLVSISAALLSIGYTFNMIGTLFGFIGSNYIPVFVNFMIFIVMVYFFRSVFFITCKVSKEEEI